MSRPLVSIILPIYNAGEYLRPCLDTLVNQTLRDIEIICVLDCPTDGSDAIVEEYAKQDKRIVVIKTPENLNIGESRNVGLRAAKGEYIGFSDHDDTRTLDMYEKLYAESQIHKSDVVISGVLARWIEDKSRPFSDSAPREKAFYSLLMRDGLPRFMGHVTPNLYHHQFLLDNGICFVDTRKVSVEDIIFNEQVFRNISNDKLFFTKETFYQYRLHESNAHLQSWYRDISHVTKHVINLYRIALSTSWVDQKLVVKLITKALIEHIYTCFRKDLKGRRYRTILAYKSYMQQEPELLQIIKDADILSLKMTPPKTLIALWLKVICM